MRIDTAAQMQFDSGKISLVGGLGLFNLGEMFCVQCVLIQEIPHWYRVKSSPITLPAIESNASNKNKH